jgi:hypothetical protein
MFKNVTGCIALFAIGAAVLACGSKGSFSIGSSSDALKDPKTSIAYQLELVKAGDVDKLKDCVTAGVRDAVTKDGVDKAKSNASSYTVDDLYDSAEMGESGGKKTAKVKMKNGRTLTTLVQTDGKWLSDTIWFK